MASAFKGMKIEARMYETHRVLVSPDVEELFKGTVIEGCIGETLSALHAARKTIATKDPIVRAVWSKIATDEAFHASFAWRVVQWILMMNVKSFSVLLKNIIDEKIVGPSRFSLSVEQREDYSVIVSMVEQLLSPAEYVEEVNLHLLDTAHDNGEDYQQVILVLRASIQSAV